ncbi:hypothetical protein Tco_0386634 [Tanacetum coccineum]
MVESLPIMVDTHIKELVKKKVPEQMIAKAILQKRGNIQAEISSQIQKEIDNQIPSKVDVSVRIYPLIATTKILAIWLALRLSLRNLSTITTCRPSVIRPRDQDDPHDDAHPEGENSAKRQKTSEYEAYVSGESSSGQVNEEERGPCLTVVSNLAAVTQQHQCKLSSINVYSSRNFMLSSNKLYYQY